MNLNNDEIFVEHSIGTCKNCNTSNSTLATIYFGRNPITTKCDMCLEKMGKRNPLFLEIVEDIRRKIN